MYKKRIDMFALLLVLFCATVKAQCPWAETGISYWSSAATWSPSSVPIAGSNVVIKSGQKVVYDVTTAGITYAGITVQGGGQLILDGTKDVVLETKYIWVMANASLRVGSSSCRFTKKATITLFGAYDTTTNIGGLGNKHIGINGNLEMFGNPPSPTWTNVVATVNVNATTITVKDTLSNWKVGDSIALASTDYYQDLTEVFTITAISGKTITLNRPAKYLHWGADNQFAEVGYLSRNILVQGDISSDSSFFGGHAIVAGNGLAKLSGVEFNRMGQKGLIGRYPFHFHIMGDQIGKGHFVKDCTFRNGYQRCLTVHGTSGILVQNNVGFNVTGHCYFLEEGSETQNVYDHNLGMVVNAGSLIPTDAVPSIFWITNPNNTWTNNVAVGGVFGFWFSLPLNPLGLTSYQTWVFPRTTPLIRFEGNLAHSASRNGIHADDFPNADGTTTLAGWNPTVPATFNFNSAYKNRQYGIWLKGGIFYVRNALLIDNGIGVNCPGSGNLVYDSTIVGETSNIGTPAFTRYYDDKGRSRPVLWNVGFPIHGWEGYDASGLQFARNVTFINFVTDAVRRAGAFGALPNGKNVLAPNDMFSQITLINSNAFAMVTPDGVRDGPRHVVFHDTDGSVTGAYGNTINSNNTITMLGANCVGMAAWGGFFNCSQHPDGYSQIVVTNQDPTNTEFGTSLNQTYRATWVPFGLGSAAVNVTAGDLSNQIRTYYTLNAPSRRGYLLKFPHPTPPQLQVSMRFAATGEWNVIALQYPSTTFSITRGYSNTPVTPAASLSALSPTTYFYDTTNKYLYVMYFEDNGNLKAPSGFPMYGYGAASLTIRAGCGKTCTVTGTPAVPSAWSDNEDKYKSVLKGCSAGTTSTKVGNAFIAFNKNTHFVTYLIYHNIPLATTGGIYSNGALIQNLTVAQAPIRGAFQVSWLKHNAMWNGNWTIRINSAQFPNGEIAGSIGCVNSACSAPPKVSAFAPCTAITGENILYNDSINTGLGWADWSGNSVRTFNYSADKQCGVNSVRVVYASYGSLSLHVGLGNCNPGQCTQSWHRPYVNISSYSFFQFYAKSPSGPIPGPLQIQAQNSSNVGTVGPAYNVPFNYIDNYVVEETWTRVRVPLSLLGFTGRELIGKFSIIIPATLPNNHTLLIDEVKLVPNYSDPVTKNPVGSVKTWTASC